MNNAAATPRPGPGITGPVVLIVAGGVVSQAAITRTAALAAGALVTVVGIERIEASEISRTDAASRWPPRAGAEPEQVRRTVALAMSVLEDTGVMAMGHIVTGSPARAVARMARAGGARVVILDQPGPSSGGQPAVGLMAELRRRMYGSGIIVLAETDRRGGWVSV
jgi:hypothetical protein